MRSWSYSGERMKMNICSDQRGLVVKVDEGYASCVMLTGVSINFRCRFMAVNISLRLLYTNY